MYANVHFRGKNESAFEPDHFLGLKTRKKSDPGKTITEANAKLAVIRANASLSRMRKGAPAPEELPDLWTAPYKGAIN
jgi:hypothetical protein